MYYSIIVLTPCMYDGLSAACQMVGISAGPPATAATLAFAVESMFEYALVEQ